ncbi:fasciclin-2-like isoform X3 [Centruroides vittatus]|uniref:fasciclin-2-like isoform X3 n=1 Tax=Centruroides vittatus TaxID=120091 RepID=UPI00350FD009
MWDRRRIGRFLGLFLTVLWFHIVSGAELIIKPVGEKQSQPAGKGFVLTCQGSAENVNLFTDMKWIDPKDEPIDKGSHKQIEVWSYEENQLALIFRNPAFEQSGRYKCIALYSNTDRYNASVDIIFYKDITWEECPQQQALIINKDGKIRCQVSANPSPSVTWYKDGKPIEDDRYETAADGITVKNVEPADEGVYSIRAMVTQTGRFQTKPITVQVHVPPKIIQLESIVEVTEGEEAALTCEATGSPPPEYTWLDPRLQDLSSKEGYFVGKETGVLTIRSVKKEDFGNYTCVAKNDAGTDSKILLLTVVVKPEIRKFDNITVIENKEAKLECHAFGEPLPKLSIRKDGNEQPFGEDSDHVHLSQRKEGDTVVLTMVIPRTMRSNDGLYYCSAENKGAHVERVGHITVEFAPIMRTPITQAKTWNDNPVNLTCIAEAIPNATITWWYNGQEIKEGNHLYVQYGKSSYSNLLVKPSRHLSGGDDVYGPYQCKAENPHGKKEIIIELKEAKVPAALLQTRVIKKTATTITFMLVGPRDNGGMAIRAYVVEFRKKDEPPDASVQREWSEDTPYILDNLKPRVAYRFKFAARNDVGIGEWTEEMEEVMPPESYPESPRFITPGGNISRYPDRFEVRWTVPQDNGKPIDYFQIRFFQVIREGNEWKMIGKAKEEIINDWENAPRYEIVSLNANSHYKVEVRAHNQIGFSQDATMIFQTAADPSKGAQGFPFSSSGNSVGEERVSDKDEEEMFLSMAAIITIVVVLVVIILMAIDVTCFLRYQWGLLYFFRSSLCGKSAAGDKAKEAAAEDGKGSKGKDEADEKSRTEVDNPAFDKEKEPLQMHKGEDRSDKVYAVNEDTPMIETVGAKDTKTETNSMDAEIKNKSPKGSKSSIAKDSLV